MGPAWVPDNSRRAGPATTFSHEHQKHLAALSVEVSIEYLIILDYFHSCHAMTVIVIDGL